MTLLYTRIYSVDEAAAALEAGSDYAYLRLNDGLECLPDNLPPGCLLAVERGPQADQGHRDPGQKNAETMIGIIPAPDKEVAASLAAEGFKTLMLVPKNGRLLKACEPELLQRFISFCHAQNLKLGLGGQIEAPDIARLLLLEPDFLVFPSDFGLHKKPSPDLDIKAIALAQDLIAGFEAGRNSPPLTSMESGGIAKKPQSRKDLSFATIESYGTDRLFIHDFILPVSIGAYKSETKASQRVRFNVDLAVRRQTPRVHDIRDIFSYDLIVDTIKLITGRGHVQFIETLAEEIATAMLAHPRIASAKVRVEKLDILEACAGIEIFRERLAESAEITQLFYEPEIKTSGR